MNFFPVKRCARLLFLFFMLLVAEMVYAQKDVTKFLGIPVDGDKASMIRNLKAKGFEISKYNSSVLVGEFNGRQVNIHIGTNNNKVCRIMVTDVNGLNEGNIKIYFNKLVGQFQNNKNYISFSISDMVIPEDEDISYEMTVNNKRYEVSFYQKSSPADSVRLASELQDYISKKYTKEQIENPATEISKSMINDGLDFMFDRYSKKSVWFMIDRRIGEYFISIFYDNEYNRANGDDL